MRRFRVVVNGSEYEVAIEELDGADAGAGPGSDSFRAPVVAPAAAKPPAPKQAMPQAMDGGAGSVIAQMPGTIVDVVVSVGDQVTRGQTLLILEAMKMANEIVAPLDGIVGDIRTAKGASVNTGDILVILG